MQNGFKSLVKKRPFYLETILKIYKCVIYSDIDTIWFKDPRIYLKGEYDFWGQIDAILHRKPFIE